MQLELVTPAELKPLVDSVASLEKRLNELPIKPLVDAIANHEKRLAALEVTPPPPAPPPPATSREVLKGSDFSIAGVYAIDPLAGYNFQWPNGRNGGELNFGIGGFTVRRKADGLYAYALGFMNGTFRLNEFKLSGTFGAITQVTNVWENVGDLTWLHRGLFWDEYSGVMRVHRASDYPDDTNANDVESMETLSLIDTGIFVRSPRWGLTGITTRRTCGGAVRIPLWFQSRHNCGSLAVGFGCYASRMTVGPVSLGLSLYAVAGDRSFKTLADHSSGTADGVPSATADRGVRPANVDQRFDKWPSDRWTWVDTNANTGNWIDNDAGTRSRHGFITVPTFGTGKCFYTDIPDRTTSFEGRCSEVQIFDPAHLGEVVAGTRKPFNVQPVDRFDLTPIMRELGHAGGGTGHINPGGVIGASREGERLYVYLNNSSKPGRLRWSHIVALDIK